MKRKQRFVTPKVTRAVPLYPESDMLIATSVDDLMKFSSVGLEEVEYDGSGADGSYTVDLY